MNKELTIEDIQEIVAKDESRYLELKQTTGELYKAMTSACAFLNTDGGWVMFGITPKLKIVGQNVTDPTRQEIANALRKFEPAIDVPLCNTLRFPRRKAFMSLRCISIHLHQRKRLSHSMHVHITKWRIRQQ